MKKLGEPVRVLVLLQSLTEKQKWPTRFGVGHFVC